jgi:quinol monooxygenase YgiN
VFPDEESRQAHLNGEIAQQLMAHADDLLAKAPQINQLDVIASKL